MLDEKPLLEYSVKMRKVKDDYFLVKKSEAWKVNEVSREILKLCNGENSIDSIADKISTTYSIQKSIVLEDCKQIIEFFINEKLVTV